MTLTDGQIQILVEARSGKIAGKDPDVQALLLGGYLATEREGGAVFVLTARGRRAVASSLAVDVPQTASADPFSTNGIASDDDDEYVPDIAGLRMRVDLLLEAYPRRRLRGNKGVAIGELQKICDRLSLWNCLPSAEKREIEARVEKLNAFLVGPFPWKPAGRTKGANSTKIDHGLDDKMIEQVMATPGSLGTSLRKAVEAHLAALGHVEISSIIKRLRRKMKRRGLQKS